MPDELKRLREENEALRRALNENEGVWYWQGDGDDYPESLMCPILIRANDLRELCHIEHWFHRVWTLCVGEEGYDKQPWNQCHQQVREVLRLKGKKFLSPRTQ